MSARTLLTRLLVVSAVFTVLEVGRQTLDRQTHVRTAEVNSRSLDQVRDRDPVEDEDQEEPVSEHSQAQQELDTRGTLKHVDNWPSNGPGLRDEQESRPIDTPKSVDTQSDVDIPKSRDTLKRVGLNIPDTVDRVRDTDPQGSSDILSQGAESVASESAGIRHDVDTAKTPESVGTLRDVNTPNTPAKMRNPPPVMGKRKARPARKPSPNENKATVTDTPPNTPETRRDVVNDVNQTVDVSSELSKPESQRLVFKIKQPPPQPAKQVGGEVKPNPLLKPGGFRVSKSATLRMVKGNFKGWYQGQCDAGIIVPATPPTGKQPTCDCLPNSLLGRQVAPGQNFTMIDAPSYEDMKAVHTEVRAGGTWSPKTCTARQKVAIIVPFRDREHHLRNLVHNLHSILQRQMLSYRIVVAEQVAGNIFNKGKMMNIGFREAMKLDNYDCVIFHDVDMMLENDYSMHTCQLEPTHLGAYLSKFAYRLKYSSLVGGALAMRPEHVRKINGYSNKFQGWGGEDDDMYIRITKKGGLRIYRYPQYISMYSMIQHTRDKGNPRNHGRVKVLSKGVSSLDGLLDLKYSLVKLDKGDFFTRLLIDPDSGCSWAKMDASNGMGRGNSPVMHELSATSSSECQDECVRQARCRAVSWDSRHLKCYLHPEITTDILAESMFEYSVKECVETTVRGKQKKNAIGHDLP